MCSSVSTYNSTIPDLPGINIAEGLRYMHASYSTYLCFLRRFPQDTNFAQLGEALDQSDLQTAFLCAHTLKGLTMQLGIDAVSLPAQQICEILRHPQPDALDQARALYPVLSQAYTRIVTLIAGL